MAEPTSLSAFSPSPPHAGLRGSRLPQGLSPSLRQSFEEDLLEARPAARPKRERPHPPAGISQKTVARVRLPIAARQDFDLEPAVLPRERRPQRPTTEKALRAALLTGLLLNLIAFLAYGLSLTAGDLTRNDALLAAATLLPALVMLVVGEICKRGGSTG